MLYLSQILLKKRVTMSKKMKYLIIVISILAIGLVCFFKFVYPYATLYLGMNKFEFDFYTETETIDIEYKEPNDSKTASGLVFDNSIFKLSRKYDKPIPGDVSIYSNADITLTSIGSDNQATLESLLDTHNEEDKTIMQGILERNNIHCYADYEFTARSFNVSDYSFLDFLFLSPLEATDAVYFAGLKYNMTPNSYIEHKCYDINNGKMRFIVEKSVSDKSGDTYLISAYCIKNGITTDIKYYFSIFDEKRTLSEDELLNFLASVSYNLNVKSPDELELELSTYLQNIEVEKFNNGSVNIDVGSEQYLICSYNDELDKTTHYYAIDFTGTKVYKCTEDFENTDNWELVTK